MLEFDVVLAARVRRSASEAGARVLPLACSRGSRDPDRLLVARKRHSKKTSC